MLVFGEGSNHGYWVGGEPNLQAILLMASCEALKHLIFLKFDLKWWMVVDSCFFGVYPRKLVGHDPI